MGGAGKRRWCGKAVLWQGGLVHTVASTPVVRHGVHEAALS
ncbi:hypothetical protein ABT143_14110 [Streptomyces sp. NPDC002033]